MRAGSYFAPDAAGDLSAALSDVRRSSTDVITPSVSSSDVRRLSVAGLMSGGPADTGRSTAQCRPSSCRPGTPSVPLFKGAAGSGASGAAGSVGRGEACCVSYLRPGSGTRSQAAVTPPVSAGRALRPSQDRGAPGMAPGQLGEGDPVSWERGDRTSSGCLCHTGDEHCLCKEGHRHCQVTQAIANV